MALFPPKQIYEEIKKGGTFRGIIPMPEISTAYENEFILGDGGLFTGIGQGVFPGDVQLAFKAGGCKFHL